MRYGYRSSGRLGRIEHAADRTWRNLFYDRAGNLTADETPDGVIRYARDRMGRMLGAVLEEASGQRVETWFERDAFGRIVRERQGDRAIRYAYGERGLRAERVMPDGARTRYAYDALDALVAVDHDGHRVAFERDALGREIQRASGEAGVAVRSAYDAMDRLIEQRATAPGPGVPSVMVARQWHYDARGRVDRVDDARWGVTTYLYDRASRLASAQRGAGREVFAYDPAGSIRGMLTEIAERSSASRVAEAPHQGRTQPTWRVERGGVLRKTEQAAYDVDARGRRTVKVDLARHRANRPEGGSPAEEAMTRYTWDCRDRLREVRTPDGARVVMTYDAFGRRVRKEVTATTAAGRPRVVEFVWDGDVLAADIDSERGGRTFVHAPGTFVPLLQQQDGRVLTYVNDHLGTPKELLDPRGLVAWAAAHSAWGKIVEVRRDPLSELSHRSSVESPFRLLGQYADEETGLCYTRFRFFDPETGGWCSPDPLGIAGGLNLFGFDGSPINDIDPLGLSAWKRNLGNLIDMKDKTVRQAIQERGGNASTANQTGHMADKTLEEVAKIKSDPNSSKEDARLADTALKLVKQDKTEKAKGCKR
ncbi:RHS repeat-associated core domain-containing protein [Sorangium sp. So ce176]